MRWELEALGWRHAPDAVDHIGHRFIAMGAAGWHICFRRSGSPSERNSHWRMVGPEAIEVWRLAAIERRVRKAVSGIEQSDAVARKGGQINHERSHQTLDFSLVHIICGIPILGYIYDSPSDTHNYAPVLVRPFFLYCSFRALDVEKACRSKTYFDGVAADKRLSEPNDSIGQRFR